MKCKNCGADIRQATRSELEAIARTGPDVIHDDGYWHCMEALSPLVAEANK